MTQSNRRQARTDERFAAEPLNHEPAPLRARGRHLADGDDPLAHNAWDNVSMSAEEVAAAEALIAAQPLSSAGTSSQAVQWDKHYNDNPRNYHDRRYLQNENPTLLSPALGRDIDDGEPIVVLETGCGVGNALLPLISLSPQIYAIGCDLAAGAVERANARLQREQLAHRGTAACWDIGTPPPRGLLPRSGVDTVLAIFTLSALPPDALPKAFAHLASCLKPGGQLLLRDYGRLDLKQLKFARSGTRLGSGVQGCEWYARGDGTTAIFLTVEAVRELAEAAGLEVCELSYDKRLVVNRADGKKMHRVWLVGRLVKPGKSESVRRWWKRPELLIAAAVVLAACVVRWRVR